MVQAMLLKKTPLNSFHLNYGAKLVEFGGWEMPLQFTKVLEEHHAVREACGLFDISHMGIVSISSGSLETTLDALNYLVPQDLKKVPPGKAVYTQLLNHKGGIIDDIIVYRMPQTKNFTCFGHFMVICNAANTKKDMEWLKKNLNQSVNLEYFNDKYALIALQGPVFEKILESCNLDPIKSLPKRFNAGEFLLGGKPVLISRTGYTGEDGVEIIALSSDIEAIWKLLLEKGDSYGLKPVGLAARDTLRLEAAYPLHGAELTEDITPLEAGLEWSIKLDKPEDFIGKSALIEQKTVGLKRHFICFEVLKKSIPRQHDLLYDIEENILGEVTSGSISPTLNIPIGVGYVNQLKSPEPGYSLKVNIRGTIVDARVVERPFYRINMRGS